MLASNLWLALFTVREELLPEAFHQPQEGLNHHVDQRVSDMQ